MRRLPALTLSALTTTALLSGCGTADDGAADAGPVCSAAELARPGAGDGVYLGVNLDWGDRTLAEHSAALGSRPAAAVSFSGFPFSPADERNLDAAVEQVRGEGGLLLLTLEPHGGLAAVTEEVSEALAGRLARYNERGVPVVVRFAHEMNGSWYPWGQQPSAYVEAFRRVAAAVHAGAPGSAVMWAPNYGGGYPFTGGAHAAAAPGDVAALDTDGDGTVSAADDPYAPYWPGEDAVDWVGMSLYHWGDSHPWGENEVPEAGKFVAQLTGSYAGRGGDDRGLPDFHAEYGERYGKPVAVPETAAFFAPGGGGADELAVKQAWWRQLFEPGLAQRLPRLAMVNWFEWAKDEPEVGGRVDWRATGSAPVRDAFRADLPEWALDAGDVPRCGG
ncbi:glycosyl hydrolase [Blastococcus sp. KM273128]|uniref:glycoside hydrolase family 26 protein n=1 Tax=Blastococcus sp. KM273128 TaxID=2570314 RepID=UPI001F3C204F|nr:glycosyl hydrolase [Blastococcus sp. KM273128]